MGKPTSADLKLGLATGPVLFACQQVGFTTSPRDTLLCVALEAQLTGRAGEVFRKAFREGTSDVDRIPALSVTGVGPIISPEALCVLICKTEVITLLPGLL